MINISALLKRASIVLAMTISPALALGYHEDRGHAAPAPLAGSGIFYLVAAGGYGAYRFWLRRK